MSTQHEKFEPTTATSSSSSLLRRHLVQRNDFETAPVYKYFEPGILCGSLVVRGRKVNNYSYKCRICMKLNRKKNGKDTFVCSAQGISSNLFHHLKSLGHEEALTELRRNHEKRRRRRPNTDNSGSITNFESDSLLDSSNNMPTLTGGLSLPTTTINHHMMENNNGDDNNNEYEEEEDDDNNDNNEGEMNDDDDGMYYHSSEFNHAQALALAEVDNEPFHNDLDIQQQHHHHHHHHHSQQQQHNDYEQTVFSDVNSSKPPYINSTALGRNVIRRPSQATANVITTPPVTGSDGSILVGAPNQDMALVQSFRTRRTKCLINFALEDFSRIHTHFSDRNRPGYIETPVYSFQENEKIKFQLRLLPSKHHMLAEVVYRGTDFSAQLLVDIYLVDVNGKRFQFEYGRKVEASVSALNSEALNNVIYDRDDLEKRRDKLFSGDKLVIGIEVNATWVDNGEQLSGISE